jgi:hypothetical protein
VNTENALVQRDSVFYPGMSWPPDASTAMPVNSIPAAPDDRVEENAASSIN